MKIKRFFLFVFVIIVFSVCFIRMNSNFDRLSRYPYDNEEDRALIDEYMSDEEIEYIIDYSINPSYFIKYIRCPLFNIYHVDAYDEALGIYWYADRDDIVMLVEKIYETDNKDVIADYMSLLKYYNFDEFSYFINNPGEFSGFNLVAEPENFNPDLNETGTIGKFTPRNLGAIKDLVLDYDAGNALIEALDEINETFECKNYGGITISHAYMSYDELKEINANPGRNIHQLGKALDLDLENSMFLNNANYVTMKEIFESHGFTFGNCEFSEYHLSYIGVKE